MFLGNRIKKLRDERHLLQRQLAASLDIDTPMYSKIERGERKAKRVQVLKLTKLLNSDKDELLTLWLADQVYEIVKEEEVAKAAIKFIEQKI
jgi:transcriptional regulator with XRE-family HTH domain